MDQTLWYVYVIQLPLLFYTLTHTDNRMIILYKYVFMKDRDQYNYTVFILISHYIQSKTRL